MNKAGTGVVIGRFQSPRLTLGHCVLLAKAAEHKRVVVLIGETGGSPTERNPLDYQTRRDMIWRVLPTATCYPLMDNRCDVEWSKQVDRLIGSKSAVIYGGRDSFHDHYSGKYPVEIISAVAGLSGTESRERGFVYTDESYRMGVIAATKNRYPCVYPCVDIAVRSKNRVLLGRKTGQKKWRFPGGFVDPIDESLVAAAKRELHEETGEYDTHEWHYVCSRRVDDHRYRDSEDTIMTTLFATEFAWGKEPRPNDDLVAVEWFPIGNLLRNIVPEHEPLAFSYLQWLDEQQKQGKIAK